MVASQQATLPSMIVTVDVNILFSALISVNGRLAKLLTDPYAPLQRISCHYAVIELFKHQPKLIKYTKKPLENILADLSTLINTLQLYNESLIKSHHWQKADRFTAGVDSFDISYVALTLQTGGLLWTGGKKLITHLRAMDFERVITTDELYQTIHPA